MAFFYAVPILLERDVIQNDDFSGHASALHNSGDPKGARPDGTNVESGPTVQGAVKHSDPTTTGGG